MKVEKQFDGYNTIAVYEHEKMFTLLKYYKDAYYCGDPCRLFTVRAGGDDIVSNFRTLNEARTFFRHCVKTQERCENEGRLSETIDEILKTWKGAK